MHGWMYVCHLLDTDTQAGWKVWLLWYFRPYSLLNLVLSWKKLNVFVDIPWNVPKKSNLWWLIKCSIDNCSVFTSKSLKRRLIIYCLLSFRVKGMTIEWYWILPFTFLSTWTLRGTNEWITRRKFVEERGWVNLSHTSPWFLQTEKLHPRVQGPGWTEIFQAPEMLMAP